MNIFTKSILFLALLLAFAAGASASVVVDTACQYSIATISQAGTGTWSSFAGNPAATTIASPTSATTTVSGFTVSGLYGYVWLTGGTHDTVEVFIKPKPNAGPDQSVCQYSTSYVTMAAVGTGIWSALTTNPSPVAFSVPISPITTVIGADSVGVYGFVWLSGGCTDTAFVTILAKPDAGPNQTICASTTATMAATGTGVWSALTTNPSASTITTPTSPTTTITGMVSLGGTYGYVWTSPNGCTDTAYLFKPYASPASMSVCIDSSPVMTILSTGPGIWLAGGGNPGTSSVANNSSPVTHVGSFSVTGTYTYSWLSNGCSVTVTIIVTGVPNDLCVNATSLGILPYPPDSCTGPAHLTSGTFTGATFTLTGQTNICATSSAPYPYASPCPINPYSPPLDVWYTFVGTGNEVTISVTGATGTLTNPTITLWGGNCAGLIALGCITGSGGTATLTVQQTVPWQTYYIQVAGSDGTESGDFTLTATSINVCGGCITGSLLTASPPPVNGAFNPGETVMFCYTVTDWGQSNANWLHGISVIVGSGWNLASLVIDSTPASCTGIVSGPDSAFWEWLPSCTGATSGITWGIGWYYNSPANAPSSPHANPGDNFGDVDAAQNGCDPKFCLSLTANPGCIAGNNLSIGFHATGDNQSGNWSMGACAQTDTVFMYTVGSCCPPLMASTPAICHQADGTISATPIGNSPPYIYHWSTGETDTINSNNPDTIVGLLPGNYTVTVTNAQHCVSTAEDSVTEGLLPNGGGPQYVSCPSIVDSVVMTGTENPGDHGIWSALSTNPAPTVIADVNSPATAISGFSVLGTYYYVWTLNGCTDTVPVIVSSHPNGGGNVATCLNGTVTMAGTGTGTWSPLPGNSSPTSIANVNNPNTTITGFSVSGGTYGFVWSQYICADTVYVLIPNFASTATALDTAVCKFLGTTLSDSASPVGLGPFTFSWSPSNLVVSPNSATTQTVPLLNPTMFYATVTTASGCVRVDSIFVDIAGAAPLIQILPTSNAVCPGDTVILNTFVVAENLVSCGPAACSGTVNLSGIPNVDTITSTGLTNATFDGISPFEGAFHAHKAQYLFRASELYAAGLSSGVIFGLAFDVQAVNSFTPYDTFTVSIGCTSDTALTGYEGGLTEVYYGTTGNGGAISPVVGWNTIQLGSFGPTYGWDGSSNLVVQICYSINPTFGSNTDEVAYSTQSYNATCHAQAASGNGCALNTVALNTQRPDIRFSLCIPPLLTYQWSGTSFTSTTGTADTVIINSDSTYMLTVTDNGCSNDTSVRLFTNPYLALTATPDTTLCSGAGDTIQLNLALTNPPAPFCNQNYFVTSIPYVPIAGAATTIPSSAFIGVGGANNLRDGTAGPYSLGFTFPFYCENYDSVWVNTSGWISLVNPYPAATAAIQRTAQLLPSASLNPEKLIAFVWGDFDLAPAGGGTVDYFVSGVGPASVFVVQFNNIVSDNLSYFASGEIHLYQTGVIEILIQTDDYTGANHTTGISDSMGIGVAAPGRNFQQYTVSTPEAWRFTPNSGVLASLNSVLWSPNTFLSNDSIHNPLADPSTTQTYYVQANMTIGVPATNCVVRDSVTITISPPFSHTLTAAPTIICPGDSSHLTFLPAAPGTTFTWTPAGSLTNATINDPVASVMDTTVFYVLARNSSGCSVNDTVTVNTYPVQHPSIGANQNVCFGDSVQLSTAGSFGTYQWYMIDSATGVTTAVSTAASIYGHANNYYYLDVVASPSGCPYFTDTVHVDTFARQTIVVDTGSGPLNFCTGGSVTLQVTQGLSSYEWTPSGFGSQQSFPVTASGVFSYTARDLHNCLLFSDTVAVNVSPPPVIAIDPYKNPICTTDTDHITATVTPGGTPLMWESGTGSTLSNDSALVTNAPGTYIVHTTIGCPGSDTITITGAVSPAVTLPASFSICNCSPDIPVAATVLPASPLDSFTWSDGSHGSSYAITATGVNRLSVTVSDANNCTASAGVSDTIGCVSLAPYATPDTVAPGMTFLLIADSIMHSNLNYTWTPDSNFSNGGMADSVSGTLNVPGTSSFHIFAIDPSSGCSDTSAVTITVLAPGNFAMADAFTPNGDGLNDFFFPVFADSTLTSARVTAFRIYNRWGQTVYDNPSAPGWDGNLKGASQPSDTYIYFVTVESPDPNNPAKKITKSVQGTVMLFR